MDGDGHEECRIAYRRLAGVAAAAIRREDELVREVERLRGIEAQVIEWFRDTDLTYPSASEAAINAAMRELLGGEDA